MKSTKYTLAIAALGAVLFLVCPASWANSLGAGQSVAPDVFSPTGLTLLDSGTLSVTGVLSLTGAVYQTSGGTLDFVFQGAGFALPVGQTALITDAYSNYSGFTTGVGYTTTGSSLPGGLFVNGSVPPSNPVTRSSDGSTLTFTFSFANTGSTPSLPVRHS
jgi:hypothetical protein